MVAGRNITGAELKKALREGVSLDRYERTRRITGVPYAEALEIVKARGLDPRTYAKGIKGGLTHAAMLNASRIDNNHCFTVDLVIYVCDLKMTRHEAMRLCQAGIRHQHYKMLAEFNLDHTTVIDLFQQGVERDELVSFLRKGMSPDDAVEACHAGAEMYLRVSHYGVSHGHTVAAVQYLHLSERSDLHKVATAYGDHDV